MPLIAVIGSINVDLSCQVLRHPEPGETLMGRGGKRSPGGKGANQALAATLQGGHVRFIGAVGDDPEAEVALELLRAAGTELDLTVTSEPTGLALITVSMAGENTIIVVPGANHALDAAQVEKKVADLPEDTIVVLQGELARATTEAAIRAAHARGLRIILNNAPFGELDAALYPMVDPLVLNEHEARLALTSLGGTLSASKNPVTEATENCRELLTFNIPSMIVTLGAHGAIVADPEIHHIPALPAKVVDTTGAGDAFVGALAARLAAGESLTEAARWAARVGARVTERPGAQSSYPTRVEVEEAGR
ncbi:MAG: ribokinase [Flaviflexus sp.]|nr:ribokinase [Flaviflexus sp.]